MKNKPKLNNKKSYGSANLSNSDTNRDMIAKFLFHIKNLKKVDLHDTSQEKNAMDINPSSRLAFCSKATGQQWF